MCKIRIPKKKIKDNIADRFPYAWCALNGIPKWWMWKGVAVAANWAPFSLRFRDECNEMKKSTKLCWLAPATASSSSSLSSASSLSSSSSNREATTERQARERMQCLAIRNLVRSQWFLCCFFLLPLVLVLHKSAPTISLTQNRSAVNFQLQIVSCPMFEKKKQQQQQRYREQVHTLV